MIRKYEGFLDSYLGLKNKKEKRNIIDIFNKMKELSEDTFFDTIWNGYSVKNSSGDGMTEPYVQIFKGEDKKGIEIPFKFKEVKDDILTFFNRMKDENIKLEFAFVYENNQGGLSSIKPKYEDLEKGLYDEKEVSILTIYIVE